MLTTPSKNVLLFLVVSTTVESFTNDKGLYFAMAEYESQAYAFIKMKNQTTDEQAGQDELYRNAFGKEKKK